MNGNGGSIAKSTSIVILTSLVIIGVALLVWKAVNILVLVFAASLLAILLYGLGSWLSEKTGASYTIGFAAAVLIVAAAVVGALWLLGSQSASQFNQLSSIIPQAWDQLQGFLKDRFWGSAIIDEVRNFNLASWASNVAFVALGAVADIVLIVVGAVYLSAQPDLYRRGLMALVARVRPGVRLKIYVISLAVILALLIGLSPVYLGVHWPTDVLAGWTMGAAWALICWTVMLWLQRKGTVEDDRSGQTPTETPPSGAT